MDLLSESAHAAPELERLGLVRCDSTREWWVPREWWVRDGETLRVTARLANGKRRMFRAGGARALRPKGEGDGQDVILLDPVPM